MGCAGGRERPPAQLVNDGGSGLSLWRLCIEGGASTHTVRDHSRIFRAWTGTRQGTSVFARSVVGGSLMDVYQLHAVESGYHPDVLAALCRSPVLRMSEIHCRVSLSVSHIYALIADGLFPPLVWVGDRARGMPDLLLDAWLWTRIDVRDAMSSLHDPVVFPPWRTDLVLVPERRGLRMLTLAEVEARVGKKRTAIYRAIPLGLFPAPVPLTTGARRWLAHEIEEWLADRIVRSLREDKRRVAFPFVPSRRSPLRGAGQSRARAPGGSQVSGKQHSRR